MQFAVFGNKQDYRDPDGPANGKSQDEKGIDLMPLDPHSHSLLTLYSFASKKTARASAPLMHLHSIFFFRSKRNENGLVGSNFSTPSIFPVFGKSRRGG